MPLSSEAVDLLKTAGLDAFKAQYGDYYVHSLNLGGDSAVLVYTSSVDTSETEKAKIVVEATFLFWSTETTAYESDFAKSHSELKFGITAFDTLDGSFVDVGPDKEEAALGIHIEGANPTQQALKAFFQSQRDSLEFEKTRQLASRCRALTENLPSRVATLLEGYKWLLNPHSGETSLSWEDLKAVMESGLVMQMTLLPFEKLRQVQDAIRQ